MNRRSFLAAALAATAPTFLAQAFAAPAEVDSLAVLTGAFHRARTSGRPLLVIVIPADPGDAYFRGHTWGEALNHGDEDLLAVLGLTEVVCATSVAVVHFAGVAAPAEEPWAWVIPAGAGTASPGSPRLPTTAAEPLGRRSYEGVDQAVLDRIQAMSRWITTLLAGYLPPMSSISAEARSAALARTRFLVQEQPPPGTYWAQTFGCGVHVEGEVSDAAIGCGMGMVPAMSQRFLYFFDIEQFRERGF